MIIIIISSNNYNNNNNNNNNYLAVDNPRGGFSCPLFQVELEFGTQPTCDYRKLIT